MKTKIKKNDKVIVTTGRDKGKISDVMEVLPKEGRVKVAGVNVVTRHTKPSAADAGGIKREERTIAISNVAHVDPKDGKATRVRVKVLANGEKALASARTGEEIRRIN